MVETKGHIVAMGGGGFPMEPDNPLLDDFILSLAPRKPARICFVPTASADSPMYLVRFYRAFSARAVATDLTVSDPASLPRPRRARPKSKASWPSKTSFTSAVEARRICLPTGACTVMPRTTVLLYTFEARNRFRR